MKTNPVICVDCSHPLHYSRLRYAATITQAILKLKSVETVSLDYPCLVYGLSRAGSPFLYSSAPSEFIIPDSDIGMLSIGTCGN